MQLRQPSLPGSISIGWSSISRAILSVDKSSCVILAAGLALALHTATRQSVTYDEAAHVPAGLAYLQHGRFDVYPHNPPLVKLCLAIPLYLQRVTIHPDWIPGSQFARTEWTLGQIFLEAYLPRIDGLFFNARLVSVLFYGWTAWLIARWSSSAFGAPAGRLATALWCFSPLALAHGSLATVDMGTTAFCVLACRMFQVHLERRTIFSAIVAGVALGLALLSKYSLLMLVPLFAVLWVLSLFHEGAWVWRGVGLLLIVGAIAVSLIPLGYCFRGIGVPWESRVFLSSTFREFQHGVLDGRSPLGAHIASLLPQDYLSGLDRQWADVEFGQPNYLKGRVSKSGFYDYYATALFAKLPLGFWAVAGLAAWSAIRGGIAARSDEASLFFIPIGLFALHQANPSLTFLRYLLPVLPFVCISMSRCAVSGRRASTVKRVVTVAVIAATVLLPLLQHPQYIGYFNEALGGPQGGWRWLAYSEIDWGQDLVALRRWQQKHPEATPIQLVLVTPFRPPYLGLQDAGVKDLLSSGCDISPFVRIPSVPSVGYLAISITLLNVITAEGDVQSVSSEARAFCQFVRSKKPLALIGSSIFVFHLSEEDVEQWHGANPGQTHFEALSYNDLRLAQIEKCGRELPDRREMGMVELLENPASPTKSH